MRLLLLLAALPASAELRVTPVAGVSLLGGQYVLDGSAASFNASANAYVSPVMKLSERWELAPLYLGSYSGTQHVEELAGGGVLTRQRQSHAASLRLTRGTGYEKLKARASYSMNLVRETEDEDWTDGLFDYRTLSAGVEAERERWWGTWSVSYDYSRVRYPNYSTLLSQSEVALDTGTFAELSANAGVNVLDNDNHRLGLGLTLFPEPTELRLGWAVTYRPYPDQTVVNALGGFDADKRSDFLQQLTADWSGRRGPLDLSLGAQLSWLASNQNSYDASRTQFIEDYYGFLEAGLSPRLALAFKKGGGAAVDLGWRRRFYTGRLAQEADGTYLGDEISQTLWVLSLTVRYPLAAGLFARGSASYHRSSSNMEYEANYRYNYSANNYLVGLEWRL